MHVSRMRVSGPDEAYDDDRIRRYWCMRRRNGAPDARPMDGNTDASMGRCSPTARCGTPRLVTVGGLSMMAAESGPRLTPDELGMYFARNPGSIGNWDIYVATR